MAQANAYGSITIVDMTDIERIYVVYAKSADSSTVPTAAASTWTESIASAPGSGNYIWQRTVVLKSGPTDSTNPSYGSPICVTGPEGQAAKEISAIETQYCNYGSGIPGSSASWQSSTPAYDATKPNYWTRTRLKYADNTYSSWTAPVKDQALTDAIYNAYIANSIATHAQEDAEGALSQANSNINGVVRLWQAKNVHSAPNAPSTEVTTGSASTYNSWSTVKPTATDTYRYFYYCDQSKTGGGICTWSEVIEDTSYLSTYEINALNVRTKNFFKGKDATYDGWFASGRTEDEGLKDNDAETYLYNARFAATNIALGYNKTPVINLDGSNGTINIYRLPTIDANTKKVTKAGALGLQLDASSLNFYEPPVGDADPTIAATLSSTGLNIVDGSITLGSTFSVNRNGVLNATAGLIGGFVIDATSIHTNGKTLNNNVSGLYMDSQGQFNTGTDEHFIASWFDSTDEEWKVAIQSNLIKFGNGELVSDIIVGVETQAQDALTSIENTNNTISGVDTITYIAAGSDSIQEAEVNVDKDTFLSIIQTEGEYEFSYNNGWYYNDTLVDLSDYGISIVSSDTIESGDKIIVKYFIEGGIYSELSDIKDTINTAIEDTATSIQQQNTEIRETLTNEVTKLNNDIETKSQGLSDRLNEEVENFNNRANSLDENITNNAGKIDGLVDDFNELSNQINDTNTIIESYINFSTDMSNPSITLGGGTANPELALRLTNEELQFLDHGTPVASITGNIMNISNAKITEQLQFGDFAFIPRNNGNLCLKYIAREDN